MSLIDPKFWGKLPLRTEIEVLPADPVDEVDPRGHIIITSRDDIRVDTGKLVLGWSVKETIGVAVVNPRGVAKGKKSVIVGE